MRYTDRLRYLSIVTAVVLLGATGVLWLRLGGTGQEPADRPLPYHRAGHYRVGVEVAPAKPRIGRNDLYLTLADEAGAPVGQAAIRAIAEMPAMGAMPAMQAPVTMTETGPGRYHGEFELGMDGAWPLTVIVETAELGRAELKFDLTTSRQGLPLLSTNPAAEGSRPGEPPGIIEVDARRRQLIGVTTAKVERRRLVRAIRAAAQVAYDETALTDISLKFDGWIGDLEADHLGKKVRKGQILFTVYSPGLVSAQEEYLESLRRGRLVEAARRRLMLWDIDADQIGMLEKRGHAATYLPILSHADGIIIDKPIVAGSPVKAGVPLLRIADLTRVWVDAEVYETDIPWVREGMDADVTLPDIPQRTFHSIVSYFYPYLHGDTRTARLRVELPNPDLLLMPAMFGTVELKVDLGKRLAVPEGAVIYAGKRRYVFVDLGSGRLQPRAIEIGARTERFIEVSSGLSADETVVTSGTFLIASESKLKSGMDQW